MKYAIAINKMPLSAKLPPGDSRWTRFNDVFANQELEVVEIANAIYTGHAYAGWHNGRRKLENFIKSSFIAVDMDTGDERSSFDSLLTHDLVQMYASLMHTTPSHTIAAPRARVIFLLDQPIEDAQGYQAAAKFLIDQFGADPACSDASRFFYGCKDCEIWMSDNVLPLSHLRRFFRKYAATTQPQYVKPVYAPPVQPQSQMVRPDAIDVLVDPVRRAGEGSRNATLTKQAFLAGKDIRNGRVRESEIVPQLLAAAQSVGLSEQEAMNVIPRSIRDGMAKGH